MGRDFELETFLREINGRKPMNEQQTMTESAPMERIEQTERRISVVQQADNEALSNYRLSTSVAGLCKELAEKTAVDIGGRKYVPAATMEAIAIAHGCVVSTRSVEWVPGTEDTAAGFRCMAELRKFDTLDVVSTAEGFVGDDEPLWFGGEKDVWDNRQRKMLKRTYEKRPDFAIRAMCTTRACGRVCKLAYAHVLVMMNVGLETTPLEDVIDAEVVAAGTAEPAEYTGEPIHDWKDVHVHMAWSKKHGPGCDSEHPNGLQLGELSKEALAWYQREFQPEPHNSKDVRFRRALDISMGREKADAKREEPPA
jgi:hypothetical protein